MTRWLGLACGCVFAFACAFTVSAQQPRTGPGNKQNAEQSQEMKDARSQLQHDVEEGKRLQQQLKLDQKAKDRTAVQHDQELLKANRETVKQDQEHIQQLLKGRGQGGARGRGRGTV